MVGPFGRFVARTLAWLWELNEHGLAIDVIRKSDRICRALRDETLSARLMREIADEIRRPVAENYRRGKAARIDVLAKLKRVASIPHYPQAGIQKEIRQFESLIAEDKAWKEPSADKLKKMAPAEKARYWMYHLRDCRGQKGGGLAETRIKELGRHALPILVARMADLRPTRTAFNHAERCAFLFREITGYAPLWGKENVATGRAKRRAAEFLTSLETHGRKATMLALLRRGDHDASLALSTVCKEFPVECIPALATAVKNAEGRYMYRFMRRLCKCEEQPGLVRRLLREFLNDPNPSLQFIATYGLARRRDPIVIPKTIALWEQRKATGEQDDWSLTQLMASCHPTTITIMFEALTHPANSDPEGLAMHIFETAGLDQKPIFGDRPHSPAATRAFERGLINAFWTHHRDRAAAVLAARWRIKDIVTKEATTRAKEAQRFRLYNFWRKKNGLPLIAVEPIVAKKEIRSLCERFLSAGRTARQRILTALLRHGPPAIPVVKNYRKTVTKFADRMALSRIVGRLETVVWEVRIRQGVDDQTANKLRRWIGKSLSSIDISDVLADETVLRRHDLKIERDPGRGVLVVAFPAIRREKGNLCVTWSVGGESRDNVCHTNDETHARFVQRVERALAKLARRVTRDPWSFQISNEPVVGQPEELIIQQ